MTNELRAPLVNIDHMKGFGERLIAARRATGLRQVDLADKIGMRPQTIYRLEKQGYPPARRTLEKILEVLPVSEPWLVYGVGPGPESLNIVRVVDEYLKSAHGLDTPLEVQRRLRQVNFADLGVGDLTLKDVHRVRDLIETNLALRRQLHDDGDDGG
jgi:transcriptional regulator with XRE-family HTH domain